MPKSTSEVVAEFKDILSKHRVKKSECFTYEDAILSYRDLIWEVENIVDSIYKIPENKDLL